jgi:glycosyltransferase involved in cell wall biosynthesis
MEVSASGPLVTVIIPYHNYELFIGEAIESVVAQDHRPVELILVDDRSTDDSTARTFDVDTGDLTVVRLKSGGAPGPAGARNTALLVARGAFITYLDADDLMTIDRISWPLRYLQRQPGCDVVLSHDEVFIDERFYDGDVDLPKSLRHRSEGHRQSNTMSKLYHRSVLDRVGGYDETFSTGEDSDWLMRAKASGCQVDLADHLAIRRRIHGRNLSYQNNETTLRSIRNIARRDRAGESHYMSPDQSPDQ